MLFWSQRDGWRHLHTVDRKGRKVRTLTSGEFDVTDLVHADPDQDLVYFTASPTNATQRYLYRVRSNGHGMERVTPGGQSGTHGYQISADGKFAVHTYSRFHEPPVIEMVTLPDHKVVRVLVENQKLKEKLATLLHDPEAATKADLNTYVQLEAAITAAAAQIVREEELVAAAQARAEASRLKAEPTLEAARKQHADNEVLLSVIRKFLP